MVWSNQKKSLTNRLLLIIAIAIVFNLLFSFLILSGTGAFKLARTEALEDFAGVVMQEADHLYLRLAKDAVNSVVLANNIDQRLERLADRHELTAAEVARSEQILPQMLDVTLSSLQLVLETNGYSGVFFMPLCGQGKTHNECPNGLYLRNMPDAPVGQGAVYERGPRRYADAVGIRISPTWQPRLDVHPDVDGINFITTLVNHHYNRSYAFREDSIWVRPVDLMGTGTKSIFHLVPLLDDDFRVYAILGIEMGVDKFLATAMPSEHRRFDAAYYLVPLATKSDLPVWKIGGNRAIRLADGTDILDRHPDNKFHLPGARIRVGEFNLPASVGNERYVSVLQELDLYSPLSPNVDKDWALVGVAKRSAVLSRYYSMVTSVGLSILASTAMAAAIIYVISRRHINRIVDVIHSVHNDSIANGPYQFKKVNIDEIDTLTSRLEELHRNVRDSALRMSTVFDMLEMPIGCYEYSKEKPDTVFATPSLNKMFELKLPKNQMFVPMARWRETYDRLMARPCDHAHNTYEWQGANGEGSVKYFRLEEVERSGYVIGVITDVTGQTEATKELHMRASYDEQTGLFNRHSFRKESLRRIEAKPRKKGVMMFGDLDGLKRINDEYGHSQGDRLIRAVSDLMRTLESIGGVVARLSGDEFAAYVHGFDTAEDARTALYTCLMNTPGVSLTYPDGTTSPVSMSRGLAIYPDDSGEFSTLLSCADRAMYQAKYSHKGSVVEYGKCVELDNETLHQMQNELLRMVEEHRFYYVYQPIFSVETNRLASYAVYIRPQSRTLSDPRVALETALMMSLHGKISRMLLEDNLSKLRLDEPPSPTRLMIKIMKYSMVNENEYADLLDTFAPEFKRLDVIISADTVSDAKYVETKINLCRSVGARVAFENFGVGVADSLELLELRPDMVRITLGRIRAAERDALSRRDLDKILAQCKARGVLLLATEVETEQDFALIEKWKFDLAQGYYIGYPNQDLMSPAYAGIKTDTVHLRKV